ncbi:MAG: radical SAM protein [Thermoplasmata archaeon]|nr:MAG: radical SAM protein [Thermoplasmata archaeon]
MNVLLLNLPRYEGMPIEREECCYGIPSANLPSHMAQISGFLKQAGISIDFYDANNRGTSFEEIKRIIKKIKPDLVISTVTVSYMPYEAQIATICKKENIKCIAISCPFGYAEDLVKKYPFYFAIHSEPEQVILDYLNTGKLENLKGIAYKDENGVHKTPSLEGNYSKMPQIDVDLFDPKHYGSFFKYQYSRGCPYSCSFCVWSPLKWQIKNIEVVLDDLESLYKKGLRTLHLLGAQISTNLNWTYKMLDGLEQRRIKVRWGGDIRSNEVNGDKHFLSRVKEGGCNWLLIGGESLSQNLLDGINKKQTVDQIKNTINACYEEKIYLKSGIIFNLEETMDDVKEYVDIIKDLKPFDFYPLMARAEKGTPLYEKWYPDLDYVQVKNWLVKIPTPPDLKNAQKRMDYFEKQTKSVKLQNRRRYRILKLREVVGNLGFYSKLYSEGALRRLRIQKSV